MPTPKITLDNFGLIGNGATNWLENFDIRKIGSKNVLSTNWHNFAAINTATAYGTGFTNLTTIKAFANWYTKSGTQFLKAYTGDKIFSVATVSLADSLGQIHDLANTAGTGVNQIGTSTYPDIISTKEGNLLYTSANHIGIAWTGTVKTGSGTTSIIDQDGRNLFETLGVFKTTSTTAAAKYVYNINNKELYEITSISTTTATNDTMNFAAGTANTAGDEYLVFVDNGWTGTGSYLFSTAVSTMNYHFRGQPSTDSWRRQIVLFGDDYVILNGNYLATLNVDLTTFAPTAKQLPYSTQAMCAAVNNANILVGSEYKGRGTLLLWDSYTSGWNSILETDRPVYAIQSYKDAWIALIGNTLFYTNGYDKTELGTIPDFDNYELNPEYHFNQMKILDNKIFIVSNQYNNNRARCGHYVFDIATKGWTFIPFLDKDGKRDTYTANQTAIEPVLSNNSYKVWSSTANSLNRINFGGSTTNDAVAMFYIKLPEKMRLSEIEINLAFKNDSYMQQLDDSTNTLYVSYGTGRRPIWSYTKVGAASTTSVLVNTSGDSYPAKAGQEILMVEGTTAPAGERTWVQSIANAGTITEALTISPVLSADVTGTNTILVHDLYKAGSRTITYSSDINALQTLRYNLDDFYSDKLWFEIYLTGTTVYPIDIHSINIY